MRHGEVDGTIDGRRCFVGQRDLPLTQKGWEQAKRWQEVFSGVFLNAVYCSDLRRSLDTARVICKNTMVNLIPQRALREISLGKWEGVPTAHIKENQPDAWEKRGKEPDTFRPPGGESFNDLGDRVFPWLDGIVTKIDGAVLIVVHAGVNRLIISRIQGIPLSITNPIPQDYGCLNIIQYDADSRAWKVEAVNQSIKTVTPNIFFS